MENKIDWEQEYLDKKINNGKSEYLLDLEKKIAARLYSVEELLMEENNKITVLSDSFDQDEEIFKNGINSDEEIKLYSLYLGIKMIRDMVQASADSIEEWFKSCEKRTGLDFTSKNIAKIEREEHIEFLNKLSPEKREMWKKGARESLEKLKN